MWPRKLEIKREFKRRNGIGGLNPEKAARNHGRHHGGEDEWGKEVHGEVSENNEGSENSAGNGRVVSGSNT